MKDLLETSKSEIDMIEKGKRGNPCSCVDVFNFTLAFKNSQSVDNVLTCSICMDYIVSCKTAICGHSFCEICIHEALIRKKECPNCRKDIRKYNF